MKNKRICVGVTALKTVESPQPGFAVARALKEVGFKIIGIDDTPLTSAVVSPYFDSVYVVKSLKNEDFEAFKQDIINVKNKEGLDIIIPCYDKDVFFFIKHREQIENLGIKLLLPDISSLKLTSKPFLSNLKRFGILTPHEIIVSNKNELETACKKLGFPVVCKGVIKDAYVAKDFTDALIFFDRIREIWHGGKGDIILQEFIVGDFYCVAGVADYNSKIVQQIQMKKLGIDSKGTTWSGFTVKDKKLEKLAKTIINSVKWIGPYELEFIKNNEDGKFYLFEINPRMPSWIYLSVFANQNLPEVITDILLEKKLYKTKTYMQNIAFVRHTDEVSFKLNQIKKVGNIKIR